MLVYFCSNHILANFTFFSNIRMENWCDELIFWCFERIVIRELDVESEISSIIRSISWSTNGCDPTIMFYFFCYFNLSLEFYSTTTPVGGFCPISLNSFSSLFCIKEFDNLNNIFFFSFAI